MKNFILCFTVKVAQMKLTSFFCFTPQMQQQSKAKIVVVRSYHSKLAIASKSRASDVRASLIKVPEIIPEEP